MRKTKLEEFWRERDAQGRMVGEAELAARDELGKNGEKVYRVTVYRVRFTMLPPWTLSKTSAVIRADGIQVNVGPYTFPDGSKADPMMFRVDVMFGAGKNPPGFLCDSMASALQGGEQYLREFGYKVKKARSKRTTASDC